MELLAVIEDNRRRYLVFDDIPELTYRSFKPEREIETVEEGEIGEFKFSEDFSVSVGKNEMTLKVKGKLSGDYELMKKAVELQSLFKKKAKVIKQQKPGVRSNENWID